MNLSGLHVLLTYKCTYECDHCFVWGSPYQAGVFTLDQLKNLFQQVDELKTIRQFYFEGGETFIYYPILVKAVARAHALGYSVGIVTNGYWATGVEEALTWLKPLAEAGLDKIEISSDIFHGNESPISRSYHPGSIAAGQLGIEASAVTIEPPSGHRDPEESKPGLPLTGGDVMYRGRAADMLTEGLPRQPWDSLTTCPYEDLASPGRIHLDPFGNLHLCQGLVIGNIWQRPLKEIIETYTPEAHPIVGPLLKGGPAYLARRYDLAHETGYVDACHLCYKCRQALRPQFLEQLAPDQMYGVA